MQQLEALPRKMLGKITSCLTLWSHIYTAVNAIIWDILLVIQRAQVFLLSFFSIAVFLSIFPGLMQSCSQIVIFVPTRNERRSCQTDMLGGSYWLINLFAVEQDYFVYTELLASQFSQRKGRNRKKRSGRKSHGDSCRLVSSLQ